MIHLLVSVILGSLVYFQTPVIVGDKTIPGKEEKCPVAKMCSHAMLSCRCKAEGDCEEISCQDKYLSSFCYCVWQEKRN